MVLCLLLIIVVIRLVEEAHTKEHIIKNLYECGGIRSGYSINIQKTPNTNNCVYREIMDGLKYNKDDQHYCNLCDYMTSFTKDDDCYAECEMRRLYLIDDTMSERLLYCNTRKQQYNFDRTILEEKIFSQHDTIDSSNTSDKYNVCVLTQVGIVNSKIDGYDICNEFKNMENKKLCEWSTTLINYQ